MNNKVRSIKIAILCFVIYIGMMGLSQARVIGEFSNFRITSSGNKTGYISKETNSYYVLNLYPSENLAPMNVKHVLVNSNNEERSSYALLRAGQRGTYSNWASKGYNYSLKMSRENWRDRAAAITGSWSPDSE